MFRIIALNEDGNDDDLEEEVTVTREAQETIAESEYMRAIKLKSSGSAHSAVSLLSELLETKVLNEASLDNKKDKLLAIRYNCHKNIAIICEENKQFKMALKNYIMAMQIDDSDVYTMHRFGQLALKSNALEIAEFAFDICLSRNSLHWSAADGILQTLCRNQNVLGAYGWALKLNNRDPYYNRAVYTLHDILTTFKYLIPFLDKFWGNFPLKTLGQKSELRKHVFLDAICKEEDHKILIQINSNVKQFYVQPQSWISVGNQIISLHSQLNKSEESMMIVLRFDVASDSGHLIPVKETIQEYTDSTREDNSNSTTHSYEAVSNLGVETNSQSPDCGEIAPLFLEEIGNQIPATDVNIEDSDSNTKSDGNEVGKPKSRRRCSDLNFLEQWGWHKNRRYSSRKKTQRDRTEIDTTLNGFLRRIFSKFINTTFESIWPFNSDFETINASESLNNNYGNYKCEDCKKDTSLEFFENYSEQLFNNFVKNIQAKPTDLMLLLYKWLKNISLLWNKHLSDELKELYMQIFTIYLKHFDFGTWNQLSNNNFKASYRICLFFLELECSAKFNSKREISSEWKRTFSHLMFNSGRAYVALGTNFENFKLRLINLEYLWCRFRNQLEKCVTCLKNMELMIIKQSAPFVLHLPNLATECITTNFVNNTCIELQRQIALNKVSKLFEDEEWLQLSEIIKNNLLNCWDQHECEFWLQDFKTQVEILLQSLWNISAYEECFVWSEKCLHYNTSHYLRETKNSQRQKMWAESINFVLSYIEALILNEGFDICSYLEDMLARLVQNLIHILSYQLDAPIDKNNNPLHELETKRPWVILHQIILREETNSPVFIKEKKEFEDDDDTIPNSFLVLFTAHEFLGKRQWCTRDNGGLLHYILNVVTPNLRAPLYDVCRDSVYEHIEQVTYCLYGYPQKKARCRHLEDHEANPIELTWLKAIQVFDLYRPECLPEFNSYKLESISADMEQLLLKIIALMPKKFDPTPATTQILDFISGESNISFEESPGFILPFKICNIFYLLADYYFKNRDFSKTIKYYTLDLAGNPSRFDSWAGIALSKASKIETKLNGLSPVVLSNILMECDDTLRCFERCISLNQNQTLLWIEYGSFTYTIYSCCSRHLKQLSGKLSTQQISFIEERKNRMLNIAYNCFSLASTLQRAGIEYTDDNSDSHEEKWLCQYMLGKIAENRKDSPKIYLNYYIKAANYLYESNATYPIKINHSSPTQLSVEALEVFYRTNSSIIKFLEQKKNVSRENGDLFSNVLTSLANSPFAFNKAKIDGNSINALKRKFAENIDKVTNKVAKVQDGDPNVTLENTKENHDQLYNILRSTDENVCSTNLTKNESLISKNCEKDATEEKLLITSPARRESQESGATVTTTTVTSSTTSTTSSLDSSSSDSDSDSYETSSDNEFNKSDKSLPYTEADLEDIYKSIVQNLEECVTRFPEHYKSLYRLVYHYMNGPKNMCDLNRCEQLLLGQYKTTLGNQINGLFFDRKNNNIFNGIWRIPSSEIDRPGSFSAHLVKCVKMLIQLLLNSNNYKLLVDIGLQLYKSPDQDKRYIKDDERIELYQLSITNCAKIMRNILEKNIEKRDDMLTLDLLIDIYKIHKKCIKYISQKEPLFTQLLVDVYKFYILDKIDNIPENLNILDLAIKLCLQELSFRKNFDKSNGTACTYSSNMSDVILGIESSTTRTIQIPGLTHRAIGRSSYNKTSSTATSLSLANTTHIEKHIPISSPLPTFSGELYQPSDLMSMISFFGTSSLLHKDSVQYLEFQRLIAESYKNIIESRSINQNSSEPLSTNLPPTHPLKVLTQPSETSFSATCFQPKITAEEVKMSQPQIPETPQVDAYTVELLPVQSQSGDSTSTLAISNASHMSSFSDRGGIFLKPLVNLQSGKSKSQLPELPKSLTITSFARSPIPNESKSSGEPGRCNKFQPKVKTPNKNKLSKPYNRPILQSPSLTAEIASQSMLTTFNTDNYNHHAILATYGDLLKSTSMQQLSMLSSKSRQASRRKFKPNTSSEVLPTLSSIPAQAQQISIQSPLPNQQSPFSIQTYENNMVTMTTIPTSVSTSITALSAPPFQLRPLGSTSFAQQQSTAFSLQISPTKTLQQKLAERQKANQLNDSMTPTNTITESNDKKPAIDVIILD